MKSCTEQERLVHSYTQAALKYNWLNTERIIAAIKGVDPPTSKEIAAAERRKQTTKSAVLTHQKRHGC
jgi:lambda repressor-like predicted transcriptional regulator